ncbi:sentrin-specific protease 1 isoform X2 [Cephus cinctus]|uniref:Sentrin-specific protease 1 isoform X2 n=1 Tax=Cephus cinctus TaxID=211228 RepID=A0AAJ7CGN4_CEPCN|nr:sentrin-specific protease 1 isoform X2 [Cephus cinctus]
MMIFDFLKRIFGWVDEGGRKRKSSSSSGSEESSVRLKKRRCNHDMGHRQESFVEPEIDSDDDDIAMFVHHTCTPTPTNKMFNEKTHRLREKRQYREMLQSFVPSGIQVLNATVNMHHRPARDVTEIIDLEKSEQPSFLRKDHDLSRIAGTSTQSPWVMQRKRIEQPASRKETTDDMIERLLAQSFRRTKITWDDRNISKVSPSTSTEFITTNTLRDKLAARAVMKQDFVPDVAKRYNARIEQHYKEAEELKRMTGVLSKHNRLAREAAWEEQLAKSMRYCEAVLDEREEPEEPPLPELTSSMLEVVKNALLPRPPNEVLVEGFGLRITRKDIHTLSGLNWLNDEVINFYMNLLIVRGTENEKLPKVHAMNTFFYPKLIANGHASLKRWTRKIDIFAQDIVVVPVHLGIHWCMSIIDFRDKSIRYYDSMGGANLKCLSALRQYLEEESLDKKKKPFDTNDWKLECVKNIPQQMNGSDCGVFSCMFAEHISANRKINFTQQEMPYFRNKMVFEILKSKLL